MEDEQLSHPPPSVILEDHKDHHPRRLDPPHPEEESNQADRQTERREPAVQGLNGLVQIRQGDREADRLPVDFGQEHLLRVGDRGHLVGEVPELRIREGNETPLPRGRGSIHFVAASHIGVEVLLAEGANGNPAATREPIGPSLPLGDHVAGVHEPPGQEIPGFHKAALLEKRAVVPRIVVHHRPRRRIECFHQHPTASPPRTATYFVAAPWR